MRKKAKQLQPELGNEDINTLFPFRNEILIQIRTCIIKISFPIPICRTNITLQ